MKYEITLPFSDEDLKKLSAGDEVLLSGTIYAARDAAHRKMYDLLEKGEPLPFNPKGAVIFYVGPTPARPGKIIGSAGPTTAGRMDLFSPRLFDEGIKAVIGKGVRSEEVKKSMVKNNAVYFAMVGGVAALAAEKITSAKTIAWGELGTEALREMTVEKMPLTVAIDTRGKDIYVEGPKAYLESVK